jgi:hypothetical protein
LLNRENYVSLAISFLHTFCKTSINNVLMGKVKDKGKFHYTTGQESPEGSRIQLYSFLNFGVR